jgi:hypothetical protein
MSATLKPVRAMDPQPSCCTGGRTTSTATSTRRRCWRPGAGSMDGQYHRGALAGAVQGARVGERISAGPWGWGWRRDGPTHVLDHLVDRLDYPTGGMEQAQLMRRRWPDLGQHGRMERRVIGDHLVWLNTSRFQPLQEDGGCPRGRRTSGDPGLMVRQSSGLAQVLGSASAALGGGLAFRGSR